MKKRLFSAFALVLCIILAAFVFAGCGEVDAKYYVESKAQSSFSSLSKIAELEGYTYEGRTEDIISVTKTTSSSSASGTTTTVEKKLFDLNDNAVIATYTGTTSSSDANSTSYSIEMNAEYIAVRKTVVNLSNSTTEYTLSVLDVHGDEFYTKTSSSLSIVETDYISKYLKDVIKIGNEYFRINDDKSVNSDAIFNDTLKYLPSSAALVTSYSDKYYTFLTADLYGTCDQVVTYDKSFKLVHTYVVPSYATGTQVIVLDSGDFVVQYSVRQDSMASKYDYLSSGVKYNLETKLVRIEKNKIKDIDCDYFLTTQFYTQNSIAEENKTSLDSTTVLSDKYDCVVLVTKKIEDKNVKNEYPALMWITEKGKTGMIESAFDNQSTVTPLVKISADRYAVITNVGNAYIINANGEIVREFPLSATASTTICDDYILLNDKIYNEQFEIVEENLEGYTYVTSITNGLVFTKTDKETVSGVTSTVTNYYLYNGDGFTKIAKNGEVSFISKELYRVKVTSSSNVVTYDYYNGEGEKIASGLDVELTSVGDTINGIKILKGTVSGKTQIYVAR